MNSPHKGYHNLKINAELVSVTLLYSGCGVTFAAADPTWMCKLQNATQFETFSMHVGFQLNDTKHEKFHKV